MGKLILVTGGARSGKSCFAEEYLEKHVKDVLYVATAIPFDNEMKDRIKKHQAQRPPSWETVEAYRDLYEILSQKWTGQEGILLDCVTVMLTNLMFEDTQIDWDTLEMNQVNEIEKFMMSQLSELCRFAKEKGIILLCVTNEIGLGIVPENRLSRLFRDIQGRCNQQLAKEAAAVYLVVSGIPMQIK